MRNLLFIFTIYFRFVIPAAGIATVKDLDLRIWNSFKQQGQNY